MASTLAEISALLDAIDVKHVVDGEIIRTGFTTDLYEDYDSDHCANLVIRLEEDGELLRIQAPNAYTLPKDASPAVRQAVLQTLHQLNWESKIMQYEMDFEDGEIRAGADFPIEDGQPTEKQLSRLVRLLPNLIDQGHLAMRDALERGIPMPTEAELCRRFDSFLQARP